MDYYADVPQEQREALRRFRHRFPIQSQTIGGYRWNYIDTGGDKPPLLILVGGLRVADASFMTTAPMAEDFRVIVPSYPPITDMDTLCDGLAILLDVMGIKKAHLLAGSFGGMVAQVFVRQFSSKVRNLVLSSTGIPEPAPYKMQLQALRFTPWQLSRRTLSKRFLDMMAVTEDQKVFWQAYLQELFFERLEKEDIISTLRVIIDFASNHTLNADDLDNWDGQALIIESKDDATFDTASREEVTKLYPGARFHRFDDAGHSPSMNKPEEYRRVVRAFLLQEG